MRTDTTCSSTALNVTGMTSDGFSTLLTKSSQLKPEALVPLTSTTSPYIIVGSTRVYGLPVDQQTRCVHWHTSVDIVALSHPCCERFYPCADCHDAVTDHERTTSPRNEQRATVLCGACGHLMTAKEYIGAVGCPECKHPFNPKCALHREKYFGPA